MEAVKTSTRNRFRTVTRRRFLGTTTTTTTPLPTVTLIPESTAIQKQVKQLLDQRIESTVEYSKEEQTTDEQPKETTELSDLALALNHIQKAPPPTRSDKTEREQRKYQVQTANSINVDDKPVSYPFEQQIDKVLISSPRPFHPSITSPAPSVRITTRRPKPRTTAATKTISKPRPSQIFDKIPSGVQSYTYKPITDYDYYDDGNPRISIPENSKVLIHSSGVIQCLDQGNFPHPVSCKKFISCAKMETGNVLGWEYTCPKNLSFDPIGGMCNWSAGLGCNE